MLTKEKLGLTQLNFECTAFIFYFVELNGSFGQLIILTRQAHLALFDE